MPLRVLKHNFTKYIRLDTLLCQACWKCVEACPNGVIGKIEFIFHKHSRIDNAERCKGCRECVKVCPQKAITAYQIEKQKDCT